MKRARRICLLTVQVPFVRGGAEVLASSLSTELQKRGFEVETIAMPFLTYPKRNVLQGTLNFRLLDLESPIIPEVDLCIPLKFPAYAVRHRLKVPWLLHQFRDAYDIFDSSYYHFTASREDVEIREAIVEIDNQTLRECRHIYTISRNVSRRLEQYNSLSSEPLYPPPANPERYSSGPFGDYVLSVGRLEVIKRVEMLVRAMKLAPQGLRCLIVGEGSQRESLARLIEDLELSSRVQLLGRVGFEQLLKLYAGARGVFYSPFDEDYGYVTLEAFLSGKPVITCEDSGGPLEFVQDRRSGWIIRPDIEEAAEALASLDNAKESTLESMGREGAKAIRDVTWERVAACFSQFLT